MQAVIGISGSRSHFRAPSTSPSRPGTGAVVVRHSRKLLRASSMTAVVLLGIVGSSLPSEALTCPSSPPVSADNSINMKDFAAVPRPEVHPDVVPLLNCALTFPETHGLRAIYLVAGPTPSTPLPQNINFPITILGDGKGRTYLVATTTRHNRAKDS